MHMGVNHGADYIRRNLRNNRIGTSEYATIFVVSIPLASARGLLEGLVPFNFLAVRWRGDATIRMPQ